MRRRKGWKAHFLTFETVVNTIISPQCQHEAFKVDKKHEDRWKSVIWSNESKSETFGSYHFFFVR